MKVSDKIKQRLKEAGVRYHSNDNIADYINEGELQELQNEVAESFAGVLDSLVIDTDNDHNTCLLYTSPSPRDQRGSRMPSSA